MDGIQNVGSEKGISDIEVQLAMGSDTTFSKKAWTNDQGHYSFLDLVPGVHFLCCTLLKINFNHL